MSDPPVEEGEWYWDRRTNKAYLVRDAGGESITLSTVWHRAEVDDARSGGALVPIDEVGLERVDTMFDLTRSFRFDIEDAERPARQPEVAGDAE